MVTTSILATVISMVGFRPARHVMPSALAARGSRPIGVADVDPLPTEGQHRASPSREEAAPTANPDTSADASDASAEALDAYTRKLMSFEKPGSVKDFVLWMRRRDWLGPFSPSGFYTQYEMWCMKFERYPLTQRQVQNQLKKLGVHVARQSPIVVDGKITRPTFYALKALRKKAA